MENKGKKKNIFYSQNFLDIDYDTAVTRTELKFSFIRQDNNQMRAYIENLEKTLIINKSIISQLVSTSNDLGKSKKIIEELHKENEFLHNNLKCTIKERNDIQTKCLLTEQILADSNAKIKELEEQLKNSSEDYLDQLNRKEYLVQKFLQNIRISLKLLKKYSKTDKRINLFIESLNEDETNFKISDVVSQNKTLKTEVKTVSIKMRKLTEELSKTVRSKRKANLSCDISDISKDLDLNIKELIEENKKLKEQVKALLNENIIMKQMVKNLKKNNCHGKKF